MLYPISHYIDYLHHSPSYKNFVLSLSFAQEHKTFRQAIKSKELRKAMAAKIYALAQIKTWEYVDFLQISKWLVASGL